MFIDRGEVLPLIFIDLLQAASEVSNILVKSLSPLDDGEDFCSDPTHIYFFHI